MATWPASDVEAIPLWSRILVAGGAVGLVPGMIAVMSPGLSFAEKPTLTGEHVVLRPVCAADAYKLAATDDETDRLTGTHRTFTLDELERWYGSRAEHDDRLDLAIVERASGQLAGELALMDLDVDNRSCAFRIALVGAGSYGRGLGTEASRLVLAHAFDTVGLHRVDLEVYAFNPRARHVYEKLGFVYEGTKRQALYWDGEWVDARIMSILSSDWAQHQSPAAVANSDR